MRLQDLLIATLIIAPTVASARDIAGCAALYRQLHNAPRIIGTTAETRRYAQALARVNADIRSLRIEMRRSGCGGGSVVVIGRQQNSSGACGDIRQTLDEMERERETLTQERDNARKLLQPSEERTAILAAIRTHSCLPSDIEEDRKERLKIQGIALPKEAEPDQGYSSITTLRTTPKTAVPARPVMEEPILPGPERPYDPSKKVRMVGPVFLPEENIDLANPRSVGPQKVQD